MKLNLQLHLKSIARKIALAAIVVMLVSPAYANTDYSLGLEAYLNQEYVVAQSAWLRAAQANDAKAMFNLGLLHQLDKIENSETVKAEKWFSLAAKNGYSPAAYHLATWLRERGADESRIRQLEQQAADLDFAPAVAKVSGKFPAVSSLQNNRSRGIERESSKVQSASTIADKAITDKVIADKAIAASKAEAGYQSEAWISELRSSQWTIQMLAFKERAKVHQFIDHHGLHQRVAYFSENNAGGRLYKLIYGAYGSKEQAESARQNLSAELKKYGPWLRPVESVQRIIDKQ